MRNMMLAMSVLFTATGTTGCGNSSLLSVDDANASPSAARNTVGGVAVIDVDVVARQLDTYDVIAERAKKYEDMLKAKLKQTQTSYLGRIEREEQALSDRSTVVDLERVDALKRELNTELLQDRAKAQREIQKYRADLVNTFRDQVRPIAQQVASRKGLSLVVSKNDNVIFSYEPVIDITNDVIAEMRSSAATTESAGKD